MDKSEVKAKIEAEANYWLGIMTAYGEEPDRVTRFGEKMRELLQLI
jgi:hypothetical protein